MTDDNKYKNLSTISLLVLFVTLVSGIVRLSNLESERDALKVTASQYRSFYDEQAKQNDLLTRRLMKLEPQGIDEQSRKIHTKRISELLRYAPETLKPPQAESFTSPCGYFYALQRYESRGDWAIDENEGLRLPQCD